MKREYFRPYIEIISTCNLLDGDNIYSNHLGGKLDGETIGQGDRNSESDDIPDAKFNNIWDEEDDIW